MVCPHSTRRMFRRFPLFSLLLLSLLFLLSLSACGPSSGIFHTTGNWLPAKVSPTQIYSLTTDPNNNQHIYAGTANGTVLLSLDGGQSWQGKSLVGSSLTGKHVYALGFDAHGTRLYAAADTVLAVSSDDGSRWQQLTSPSLPADQYTALAFNFTDARTLFVGTAHHGIFMSTDEGSSWQTLGQNWPANTAVNGLSYVTDLHQLWAATSRGIYLKRGDGDWQAMNNGLPASLAVNAVAPLAFNGGDASIVLAGTARGFFRSVDGGAHWAASKDSLSAVSVSTVLVDFRSTTLSTVYVGTGAGVLVSNDQGQTWGGVAPGLAPHANVLALAIGATNNTQLFAGADAIYLYPGYGGGGDSSSWLIIIIFVALMVGLYFVMQRSRRKSLDKLQRSMVAHMAEEEAKREASDLLRPGLTTANPLAAPLNSQNGHKSVLLPTDTPDTPDAPDSPPQSPRHPDV
jgi:Uncharacterized protein related to plant photosystem II stability/assembly factor